MPTTASITPMPLLGLHSRIIYLCKKLALPNTTNRLKSTRGKSRGFCVYGKHEKVEGHLFRPNTNDINFFIQYSNWY